MSDVLPNIAITEFRKLKVKDLKRLKSCEVFSDGNYLFTFVNAQTDFIRVSVERLCQRGNAVGGEELEAIIGEAIPA